MLNKSRIKVEQVTNRKTMLGILIIAIFILTSVSLISSVSLSYCCEKTTDGVWCQNTLPEKCDPAFSKAPTSCDATSYCKMGCCLDMKGENAEGTCMENTPQKVCENSEGVWADNAKCEVPQCSLGCCLMNEQAAFVTQSRCKRLSSLYGLETNFRGDIADEVSCIVSARANVMGACVFEKEFEKTCKMTTQKECQDMGALLTSNSSSSAKFYEGLLCSAESLGTNCGPSEKTTCVEGKDEVYFVDTCNNLANIYDASKIKDKNYWREIIQKSDSCGAGSGNANSATCGSCDYFLGSTCKKYKAGKDKVKPNYGDNICRDLSCEWKGKTYSHGETWCEGEGTSKIIPEGVSENGAEGAILDNSKTNNLPGTRYFRLVCYDGEVTLEPCADFRQEICIQDELNGFKAAACRVNRWQDCLAQDDALDCGNIDKRDCKWIALKGTIAGIDAEEACIPKYAPGLDFYTIIASTAIASQPFQGTQTQQNTQANAHPQMAQGQGSAESICGMANVQCVVEYEKGLTGGKKCKKNCECEKDEWENKMNNLCNSLGDCGLSMNYKGIAGSLGGVEVKTEKGIDEGG